MRYSEFQDNPDVYQSRGARRPRKPELGIFQRMVRVLWVIICVLLLLVVARLFTPELNRQRELKAELEELQSIKFEKESKVARLRREHSNLISGGKYMESIARDRLNLQRKGEYVIQIER